MQGGIIAYFYSVVSNEIMQKMGQNLNDTPNYVINLKLEIFLKISYAVIDHLFTHGAYAFIALLFDVLHRHQHGGLEGVRHSKVCPVDQLTEVSAGDVVAFGEMRQEVLREGKAPGMKHPGDGLNLHWLQLVGRLNEVHPCVMVQIH